MKAGKIILIIVIIIVVLIAIAFLIGNSNKNKTQSAINNQQSATPNPNITGRFIAANSESATDYTATFGGKPIWLWAGTNGNCQSGYTKITSGPNSGWCVLNAAIGTVDTKSLTCVQYDNAKSCIKWKDNNGNTYVS